MSDLTLDDIENWLKAVRAYGSEPQSRRLIVSEHAPGVHFLPGLIVVPTVQARDAVLAVLNDTAREKA